MIQAPAHADRRLLGLGLRLVAISILATMSVLVKLVSERGAQLPEIMFWRQSLAIPVVLAWVIAGPGLRSLRTRRFRAHATRGVLGLTAMSLNFGAIILLPLAEATTLSFTVPIFATILAALILREVTGVHRWAAVFVGFLGVLVVVQPGSNHIPITGALVGLSAAVMVAITMLQIRDMGRTEQAATTVFWFSLLSTLPLSLLLPFFAVPHDALEWAMLAGIGTLGGLGQIALTASLRFAPVSVVVAMDYVALLWATLFGWLIWDHLPGAPTWIGAPIIVASGLYIVWREHRLQVERPGDIAA